MIAPLLAVRDLKVAFGSPASRRTVVDALSFDLAPGETLAIVGESGCGKSVTALSIMRLVERDGGCIVDGRILLHRPGRAPLDLARCEEREMRRLRGNAVSMIFQEPMSSLNPCMTVGAQIRESLMLHEPLTATAARRRAIELLDRVRIDDPARRVDAYPHQLSGGMRQRVMIAIAIACAPRLLIADEPTTALDVTIQAGILGLLGELQREHGTSILFITHDMGVVAQVADRVVVMRAGRAVETASTGPLFTVPRAAYTRDLLASVPRLGSAAGPPPLTAPEDPPLLDVRHLAVRFPVRRGLFARRVANVHAVDDVSFVLHAGETLGLVGESGSGKSTLGRAILRLIDADAGEIRFRGEDLAALDQARLRPLRRDLQMVFQDPYASLDPRMKVADLVTDLLAIHERLGPSQRRDIAAGLLERVRLPLDSLDRYPHQFSGGQRQRLCIARALALKPALIVADEPVSALDVSVQAQVIALMQSLQQEDGISWLFVSHDIALVERMSHRIAVLEAGRIVETGPARAVLEDPRHRYTQDLLRAVPRPDPARRAAFAPAPRASSRVAERPLAFTRAPWRYETVSDGHLVLA
ncbi:MAG: ABC transporter ATP-binding protein [Lautropia sp.]